MRYDAMTEDFEEIMVFNKPALFTNIRIDKATVPKGLYMYEVRHNDDWSDPVQIGKSIVVNHFGTILTRELIKLSQSGLLNIDPDRDWNFAYGDCHTVNEFLDKYPPKKVERER